MRVLKDNTYHSILCAARSEFIRRGFKDASMRDVAKKADVGLSNIYNYFKNKDEIFRVVVKPACLMNWRNRTGFLPGCFTGRSQKRIRRSLFSACLFC